MLRCDAIVFISNDAATTHIYTLSLHDALPICHARARPRRARAAASTRAHGRAHGRGVRRRVRARADAIVRARRGDRMRFVRSEEHTSELQSHSDLVCRLLLEKKKRTSLSNDSY